MINIIKICDKTPIKWDDKEIHNSKLDVLGRIKPPRIWNNIDDKSMYHNGYLNYLALAWENHYSVVMRPDDIWYVIMNEISAVISKKPKEYEYLFTKVPDEKTKIIVLTDDISSINPAMVIEQLKRLVPSDVDLFIPRFSTSNEMSILAMNVSFCDMVSPYYEYWTLLCGIPQIRIEGTKDDWNLILNNLNKLSGIFSVSNNIKKYIERCSALVFDIITASESKNVEFFEKMVKLERCGSGHQFEMSGWILQLLNKKDFTRPTQLEGLPPHIAKMNYTNLDTNRKFTLYCGLFYSNIEDEFMVPEYGAIKTENKN